MFIVNDHIYTFIFFNFYSFVCLQMVLPLWRRQLRKYSALSRLTERLQSLGRLVLGQAKYSLATGNIRRYRKFRSKFVCMCTCFQYDFVLEKLYTATEENLLCFCHWWGRLLSEPRISTENATGRRKRKACKDRWQHRIAWWRDDGLHYRVPVESAVDCGRRFSFTPGTDGNPAVRNV